MKMDSSSTSVPALEDRFLQPEGWRWHVFTNPKGKKLRFGCVSPKSKIPDAVVVCLPGLSEFGEKYFETARDMISHNLAFWIIDWQGQGKSERGLANPQKRHSTGFDNDIADLDFFLKEYVLPASVHPDVGRIPLAMLAHSMGGNIGLRYLIDHPDIFSCAAFSSPMAGIAATGCLPISVAVDIAAILKECMNLAYVFGGRDWTGKDRADFNHNKFSSDPVRAAVHNAWFRADPTLQVGNVTFGWAYEALKSCSSLQSAIQNKPIIIPCLFALAGHEKLVRNAALRKILPYVPNSTVMELKDSFHEIIMEKDDIRNRFLDAFYQLLERNQIREKLKPF